MTTGRATGAFQICGSCKRAWPTCESFLLDLEVRLLGLQAVPGNTEYNLLVFEHRCGSSISILTPRLRHLLPPGDGGIPSERLFGTDQCRRHCLRLEDLEQCDAPCSNARDRQLILLVQRLKEQARMTADDGRSA